jgi:hypothetical protein
MASLWFDTVDLTFYNPTAPLSRWKAVMAARMPQGGFTNVVNNGAEVAGGRHGGWTSVVPVHRHDLPDGRQAFVIVIMCGTDTADIAKSNVSDVKLMMGWNDGLW